MTAAAASPRAVTRGEFDSSRLAVCIDWLSFTCVPQSDHWRHEIAHFLDANFKIGRTWERGGAWRGYEESARCGGVLLAWGGASQRGSVYVDIPGSVCSQCADFVTVGEWLEFLKARITRVDVAGDDFDGNVISVDWALSQYRADGFSQRGTKAAARFIDDMGSGAGRSLYVGKRANGKLACIYEKGRQLGDAASRWCRAEVRWGSKDRLIPFDVLSRPAHYLAGAFPCLSMFAHVTARIRTFKEKARLCYAEVVRNARALSGRAVNAMLAATGGDYAQVVTLLRRSGLPRRLSEADITRLGAA